MNLTNLMILLRYGKQLTPILPVVKLLIDRFGPDNAKAIVESATQTGAVVLKKASAILSISEQTGLKLLHLTPEQQEIVLQWKNSETSQS